MSKILRFEFYKLSKLKSFYICTLITLIFTVLNAISTYMIAKTNYVDFEEMGVDVPLSYTGWTYSLSAIANSQFLTVFGVFIAMHLFRHKTKHWYFRYGFPVILALHLIGGAYLIGAGNIVIM